MKPVEMKKGSTTIFAQLDRLEYFKKLGYKIVTKKSTPAEKPTESEGK